MFECSVCGHTACQVFNNSLSSTVQQTKYYATNFQLPQTFSKLKIKINI